MGKSTEGRTWSIFFVSNADGRFYLVAFGLKWWSVMASCSIPLLLVLDNRRYYLGSWLGTGEEQDGIINWVNIKSNVLFLYSKVSLSTDKNRWKAIWNLKRMNKTTDISHSAWLTWLCKRVIGWIKPEIIPTWQKSNTLDETNAPISLCQSHDRSCNCIGNH